MKLFLHWLRWDLCRFRLMLGIWTLLVLGYAAFLGWLHGNILTIDPDWMDWSAPIAKWLGVTGLLMLFYLFSTDPAGGVDSFWKTRPPTGFAVAGSKLVVALGFFVVLPLAAWQVMNVCCVVPRGNIRSWGDLSWTQLLWFSQALAVGALALTAGAAGNPVQQLAVLVAGLALAVSPMVPFLFFASLGQIERTAGILLAGAMGRFTPWLVLLAGGGFYFLVRRRRTPGRWMLWAGAGVSAVLLMLAGLLPQPGKVRVPDAVPVALDPAVSGRIRVGIFLK